MISPSFSYRKRALYTGLHAFLKDDEITSALDLWELKYAQKPPYSLRYYLAELQDQLHINVNMKQVYIEVLSCLTKPEEELLPDPSQHRSMAALTQNRQNALRLQQRDETRAFEALIKKWFFLTAKQDLPEIRELIIELCKSQPLPNAVKMAFMTWIATPTSTLDSAGYATTLLRTLCNLVYQAYCEILGPVETDALLAKAISTVSQNGGAAYKDLYCRLL